MARLSIPDQPTFAQFTVATPTSAFPISFSLFAKADLTVLIDGMALSQSTFTFSGTLLEGGGYAGGTVTLNAAVTGVTVRIERNVQPIRASQFAPSASVPVGSIDQAFNRIVATQQDQARSKVTRPAGDRAGKFLAFDAEGNETPSVGTGADAGLRTDLASSASGAALLSCLAAGTGAVARTQQDKNRDTISVKDFGAVGDGTTDDAPAIRAAMAAAAGRSLYFPDPVGPYYRCASSLGVLPDSTRLHGESKRSTRIRCDYAAATAFLEMADGSALEKLYIDGNSKTCRGLQIMGTAGNQHMNDVRILNFANDCLYFEKNAGAGFNAVGLETYRVDGLTSSNKFAIVIEDAAGGLGPKHFFGLETGGNCSIDFGGANDVYVIGSTLADCKFSANSSSVYILGCRIANAPTLTVLGAGINILGGDTYPQVILGSGAVSCSIGPGIFNLGVVDNSGSAQNQIFEGVTKSYTPTVTTSGGAVTVGNGSVSGSYQRTGTKIDFDATFIVGSTTSFAGGGGVLRISLPITPLSVSVQIGVTIYMNDASGPTPYFGTGFIEDGVAYVYFVREGGTITTGAPFAFANGDSVKVTGRYTL